MPLNWDFMLGRPLAIETLGVLLVIGMLSFGGMADRVVEDGILGVVRDDFSVGFA